jgi:hypothetical protein
MATANAPFVKELASSGEFDPKYMNAINPIVLDIYIHIYVCVFDYSCANMI